MKSVYRDLKSLMKVQLTTFSTSKQTILVQWREYLISEIQDILRETYKFYQTEPKGYFDTELQRLLRKIDFIFNNHIREIVVKNSVQVWCKFLRKFTYPCKIIKKFD